MESLLVSYKTFVEIILTERPINAIRKKETRRLKRPASNPITGGPNKNPRKPIVETVAKANPAESFVVFPAALKTIGITEQTPKPTNKKPAIAVGKYGKKTAINNPMAIKTPLACNVNFNPNLLLNQSATNLPAAMVLIKQAYPAPIRVGFT